ncbi:MAG: right-handed parallel beta-helix repeat-containing protein, partial [Thermoanaerobaculaceae bacterium]|nr:right-handed parallel beta-helix repeat-containing protein [Thermoanaerobaculaceae bacterium]
MRHMFLAALGLAVAFAASAATLQVGPGRTYTSLQQVVGIVNPGDVVEVDGNVTYPGGVTFTRAGKVAQPITIRGLRVAGNRPVLSGGTNTVAFTTPWPYSGPGADHYVFEGFDVTGGTSRCIYHQAFNLTIRDVVVHDCPAQGILGADEGSGSLLLEYTEVHHCGNGSSQHQIYMATDEVHYPGSVFRMQHCYVHDGNGGNNVKSRAERNEIYYNWIEGAFYHELELIGPDGGDGGNPALEREDSDVVGNVLLKRNTFYVTRVGGDGTGETNGRYRFVNNTFLCGSSAAFRIFDGIESIEMHNNVFHRDGGVVTITRTVEASWVAGEQIAGSKNWVLTGAASVPAQWTGTITGAGPGFTSLTGNDLRPAAGSPLLDQGSASPSGPPGYPFPGPLFPPAKHPPAHQPQAPGSAEARPAVGVIDIGAFERPGWTSVGVSVDAASHTTGSSDQNGVLEPGEQVRVAPTWHNGTGAAASLTGVASALGGPAGATYSLLDAAAAYGSVAAGADGSCAGDPFAVGLSSPSPRPAAHWDATFTETLSSGTARTWALHIGDSFADVARDHWAYAGIEALFHAGLTTGC